MLPGQDKYILIASQPWSSWYPSYSERIEGNTEEYRSLLLVLWALVLEEQSP